jgi:hypothetical protein
MNPLQNAAKAALALAALPFRFTAELIERVRELADRRAEQPTAPRDAGAPQRGAPTTPAAKTTAAERPEVVAEQTDGLKEAGTKQV